ncbi:MAG: MBL fold metallo-hydrolase [Planctomycetes bacterium]|nr:MBL fold metallo-hydrolase [Planctomycetota bacterium]
MFHYDGGLKLTRIDLAIDFCRRQPRGFISHAHADHIGRHELAFCTPATSRFYQHRLGPRQVREMPYFQPLNWEGFRLTAFPAGHIFGSAMLLAEDGGRSLLYTGDFKLGESATADPADPPRADVLVMESTFGDPQYRLPPRQRVIEQLLDVVRDALDRGFTPVLQAYVLGKAQEVTRILTTAGIPVLQHPAIYAVSRIYEACGCSLGACREYPGRPLPDHAVVIPPAGQRVARLEGIRRKVTIAVSGWAAAPRTRRWLKAEHAFPLSDHADYDELLELVRRVAPGVVYCTHGPESFVARLQKLGYDARVLGKPHQKRLF